mgnify:CR=1 FL=1
MDNSDWRWLSGRTSRPKQRSSDDKDKKMKMNTIVIAAIGVLGYFLIRGSTKYKVGDNLQITGVNIIYHIDAITTIDNIKWYIFNDGTGQFRVEVSVVDGSNLWHKV